VYPVEWEDIMKKKQLLATEPESTRQTSQAQADGLTAALRAAEDQNQRLATELEATLRSHFWKLTKPARALAKAPRQIVKRSERGGRHPQTSTISSKVVGHLIVPTTKAPIRIFWKPMSTQVTIIATTAGRKEETCQSILILGPI